MPTDQAELAKHYLLSDEDLELVHWLVPIAVDNPKGDLLVGAVLNELRRRRILHPDLVIERLVAAALRRADRRVLAQINGVSPGRPSMPQSLGSDCVR